MSEERGYSGSAVALGFILGGVLGVLGVTQHAVTQVVDMRLVSLHQLGESFLVAVLCLHHQSKIRRRGSLQDNPRSEPEL